MNACPGNVVVPIAVTNCNNVAAISLTLQYNTSVLTYTGYQNANAAIASGFLVVNASNGQVQLGWFSMTPASVANGTLLEYKFTGVIGSSSLNWNLTTPGACAYTDINNVPINSVFVNGNVNIGNCSNLEGNLTYYNTVSTPMNNTTVLLKQNGIVVNQATTNGSGHFLFSNLANGTYRLDGTSTKPWGGVNASDGLLILKHFVNAQPLSGLKLVAADVDGSGYVNSADALLDVKRFVNVISSFTPGDWVFEKDTITVTGTGNITDDFKALCYGDVDGSYIPAARIEPTVNLQVKDMLTVYQETTFDLPVTVLQDMRIGAVSLVLKNLSNCVVIEDVVAAQEGKLVYNLVGDELRIGWYDMNPMNLSAGDCLIHLKCRLNGQLEASCNDWAVNEISVIADENAQTIANVMLAVPKIVGGTDGFYLGQNVPNPMTNSSEISYYIPESGKVSLKFYDLLGKEVRTLVNQVQQAGRYTVQLLSTDFPSGVYTYKLEVQGINHFYSNTKQMVVGK
jgi:hypothetical protein